ncbi:MAG: hypothetical protein IKU66_04050 [Clostridia bacterium]|nr:hypothetical protein [Clostridia bacterium]
MAYIKKKYIDSLKFELQWSREKLVTYSELGEGYEDLANYFSGKVYGLEIALNCVDPKEFKLTFPNSL